MEKEFTEGDAFVAAYSEYFGVVYKEALKYSGNHHIAEEIAQDAFFTAYIQFGSESNATERSRKENGHYIKCIRRHTKESKKMDDKKV